MASIHIYTGPMGSGKTSKMLDCLHKFSNVTKERVLLINFKGDDRLKEECDVGISTHVYGDSSSKIPIGKYIDYIKVNALYEIEESFFSCYYMIGIDEAQFYPDLESFILFYCRKDIVFHIAGLSYDSDNKIFGQIPKLLSIATTFEKMPAICAECKPRKMLPAAFTFSMKEKDGVISIGGLDKYKPLCLKHYQIAMGYKFIL